MWAYETFAAIWSAQAVARDGTVYVGTVWVGSEDGTLYGIAANGVDGLAYKTGGPIDSSPAIGPLGEIVVGSRDKSVYLLR